MSLAAFPVAGMPGMLMGFIDHSTLCGAKASVNFSVMVSETLMVAVRRLDVIAAHQCGSEHVP